MFDCRHTRLYCMYVLSYADCPIPRAILGLERDPIPQSPPLLPATRVLSTESRLIFASMTEVRSLRGIAATQKAAFERCIRCPHDSLVSSA